MKTFFTKALLIAAVMLAATQGFTKTVYLSVSGAGDKNGTSWENAYSAEMIQKAFDDAAGESTLYIAQGHYYVSKPIQIGKSISNIYGGFKGDETAPEYRQLGKYQTVIDGDYNQKNDKSLFIDTLIHISQNVSMSFNNIVFANSNNGKNSGAAIIIEQEAIISFSACVFANNYAAIGAALYTKPNSFTRNISLHNCVSYNNCNNDVDTAFKIKANFFTVNNSTIENVASHPDTTKLQLYNTILYKAKVLPILYGGGNNLCAANALNFADIDANDFRLTTKSEAFNAGYVEVSNTNYDLAGNPRIMGTSIDIGAFEYNSRQKNAIQFLSNTNQLVTMTSKVGSGDFTIEAWFKTAASFTTILTNSYESNTYFNLGIQNGKLVFDQYADNLNDTIQVGNELNDAHWHYFSVSRKDDVTSLQIDKTEKREHSFKAFDLSNTVNQALYIGSMNASYEGQIDELRIWNTALSDKEINAYMHDTIAKAQSISALETYFRFDQIQSDTLYAEKGANATIKNYNDNTSTESGALVVPFITSYSNFGSDSINLKWDSIPDAIKYTINYESYENQLSEGNNFWDTKATSVIIPYVSWEDTVIYAHVSTNTDLKSSDYSSAIKLVRVQLPVQNALAFDSESYSSLEVPNTNNAFDLSTYTLESWIYPTTTNQGAIIIKKASFPESGQTYTYQLEYGNNQNIFFNGFETKAGTILVNKWQHVAATFDGKNAHVYINGQEQTLSGTSTYNEFPVSDNQTIIGADNSGTSFTGAIDEIRIWSIVRPLDSIKKYQYRELPNAQKDLALYYACNNSFGKNIFDLSGNAVTGTYGLDGYIEPWIKSRAMLTPAFHAATDVTDSSFTISWDAIPNAEYYRISIDSVQWLATQNTSNTYTDLKGAKTYSIGVIAFYSDKISDTAYTSVTTTPSYLTFTPAEDLTRVLAYDAGKTYLPISKIGRDSLYGGVISSMGQGAIAVGKAKDSIAFIVNNIPGTYTDSLLWASNVWTKRLDSAKVFHYSFENNFKANFGASYQDDLSTSFSDSGEPIFVQNEFGQNAISISASSPNLSNVYCPFDTATVNIRIAIDKDYYAKGWYEPNIASIMGSEYMNGNSYNKTEQIYYNTSTKRVVASWEQSTYSQAEGSEEIIDTISGKVDLIDGKTHSIATVRNDSIVQIWCDGRLLAQDTAKKIIPMPKLSYKILWAGIQGDMDEYTTGTIDEIYVSSFAANASDIKTLTGVQKSKFNLTILPKQEAIVSLPKQLAIDTLYFAPEVSVSDSVYLINKGTVSTKVRSVEAADLQTNSNNKTVSANDSIAIPFAVDCSTIGEINSLARIYTTAQHVDTKDLIVYLPFDHSITSQGKVAIKTTASNNNFTYINDRDTIYSAIDFAQQNSDAAIKLRLNDTLKKLDSAFTIAFAFKPNMGSANQYIYSKGFATESGIYSRITIVNKSIYISSPFGSVRVPYTNNWIHVAYSIDFKKDSARTYINGIEQLLDTIGHYVAVPQVTGLPIEGGNSLPIEGSGTGLPITQILGLPKPSLDVINQWPLVIGADINNNGLFNGALDEFVTYNRLLTASEIAALSGVYQLPVTAVVKAANFFIAQTPNDTLCEGSKLVAKCKTIAAATKFQWYKEIENNFVPLAKDTLDSLVISKVSVADSGKYFCVARTYYGAKDSSDTVHIVVHQNPKVSLGDDVTSCLTANIEAKVTSKEAYSAVWNVKNEGLIFTANTSGAYIINVTDKNKCQASDTLNVTITKPSFASITTTTCDAYKYNGKTYNETGIYHDTLTNIAGCDSLVTLDVTITKSSFASITTTACNAFKYNGKIYDKTGIYHDTLTNVAGCDSLVTLDVSISKSSFASITTTACNAFKYNGKLYSETGIYYDTLTNVAGCDSLVTLDVTISKSSFASITTTACNTFKYNGKLYSETGIYYDTLTNVAGCDSLVTLDVTISKSSFASLTTTACNTFEYNGKLYSETGIYHDTLTNVAGCDSLVTLDVTISKSSFASLTTTACSSFEYNGKLYDKTGIYRDTLTNIAGCDSIVTIDLTINKPYSNIIVDTVCSHYLFKNKLLTESGQYFDSLKTSKACDSVIGLKLTVNSQLTTKPSGTFMASKLIIEPGDSIRYFATTQKADDLEWYFEGGQPATSTERNPSVTYKEPGLYLCKLTLRNCNGEVVISKEKYVTVWAITPRNAKVCKGETVELSVLGASFNKYQWSTGETSQSIRVTPSQTTTYAVTLTRGVAKIKDSVTVVVHTSANLGKDTALCAGTNYTLRPGSFVEYYWNNNEQKGIDSLIVSEVGTYKVKTVDNNNCVTTDSMKVTQLYAKPIVNLGADTTVCWKSGKKLVASNGVAYLWNTKATTASITADTTGIYSVTVVSSHGCVSRDTIAITADAPQADQIGIVTQSEQGYNLIAWQRPRKTRTVAYYVQRETSTGAYKTIDTVKINERSITIDKQSIAKEQQFSYRLLAIDSCGNTSRPSTVHRTMYLAAFLQKDGSVQVEWTKYEGLPVKEYIIYRATKGEKLVEYKRVKANSNITQIFTDSASLGINSYYQVGFDIAEINVDILKSDTGPFSQSLSNMAEASLVDIADVTNKSEVSISPNPSSGVVFISTSANTNIVHAQLIDALGKTVQEYKSIHRSALSIDLAAYANGVYILKLETNKGTEQHIVVKN